LYTSFLFLQSTRTYSEEELVSALQQRNESALSYLYDQYSGALNAVIINLIKDDVLSEDILQETFLKIWNNILTYDSSKGRLFTWMRTIANNLTLDKIRGKEFKKQAKIKGDETIAITIRDEDNNINNLINTNDLKNRINNLEPRQRLILNMSYFEGYTQEQIAAELDMPVGTVKTKIRAAIIALRKTFQLN
jgi:RNA polymerase sigma factor (sigma-70 family)